MPRRGQWSANWNRQEVVVICVLYKQEVFVIGGQDYILSQASALTKKYLLESFKKTTPADILSVK